MPLLGDKLGGRYSNFRFNNIREYYITQQNYQFDPLVRKEYSKLYCQYDILYEQ